MSEPRRSQLRDLVAKLENVASGHPAFSQTCGPLSTLCDHLSAIARIEEMRNGMSASEAEETTQFLSKGTLARRIFDICAMYPDYRTASIDGDKIRVISKDRSLIVTVAEE